MDGCEGAKRTPVAEDRICPVCGREVEVFVVRGKIMESVVCDCGYEFKAEPLDTPEPKAVKKI